MIIEAVKVMQVSQCDSDQYWSFGDSVGNLDYGSSLCNSFLLQKVGVVTSCEMLRQTAENVEMCRKPTQINIFLKEEDKHRNIGRAVLDCNREHKCDINDKKDNRLLQ